MTKFQFFSKSKSETKKMINSSISQKKKKKEEEEEEEEEERYIYISLLPSSLSISLLTHSTDVAVMVLSNVRLNMSFLIHFAL